MRKLLSGLFLGAALAYFADPERGTRRRNVTMDQLRATMRRLSRGSAKMARYVGGEAYGLVQETIPHQHDNPTNPDNNTLTDRVESEVLRDPKFSRAPINFNVIEGSIVVIRGELPLPDDIDELISRVKAVRGVKEVQSYLHLPNTPAPNKESAIQAER